MTHKETELTEEEKAAVEWFMEMQDDFTREQAVAAVIDGRKSASVTDRRSTPIEMTYNRTMSQQEFDSIPTNSDFPKTKNPTP